MSAGAWVTLSDSWEIGTVRAVFALLVNVFCVGGSWAVAYFYWKTGALEVVKSTRTRLPAITSLDGMGDIIDLVPLLFSKLGTGLRIRLLTQVVLVLSLSVVAIFSGPLARFATQQGAEIRLMNSTGWLPTGDVFSNVGGFLVQWNNTVERLNSAGFPYNQLLDFLPDLDLDWKYRESEWNSSWAASCEWTDRAPIQLEATGNHTLDILEQFPAAKTIFPPDCLTPAYNMSQRWAAHASSDKVYDALLFLLFQSYHQNISYELDETTGHYHNDMPFNLTMAAFHLHDAPSASKDFIDSTLFGAGPVGESHYSLATCAVRRIRHNDHQVAFPWSPFITSSAVVALTEFYQPGLTEQSFAGGHVYLPSGSDLFRFYQTYLVRKDTVQKLVVRRRISVAVPTVELAVAALVVFIVCALLLCAGLLWFGIVRRLPPGVVIPRSKMQWIMQGVKEAGGNSYSLDVTWRQMKHDFTEATFCRAGSRFSIGKPYGNIYVDGKEDERRSLGGERNIRKV